MDFEYVAVSARDVQHTAVKDMLIKKGWEEYVQALWYGAKHACGVCIMRRPKDEPRMWTKKELQVVLRELIVAEAF